MHIKAEQRRMDIEKSREESLLKQATEAREEILRAADIGSFILSDNALAVLKEYESESENIPRQNTWYEHVDLAWSIDNKHMKSFIEAVKDDIQQ